MSTAHTLPERVRRALESGSPNEDYLGLIAELVSKKEATGMEWQRSVEQLYAKVYEEIISNSNRPLTRVKFGTSGWRGILGKDLFCRSVAQVALAIVEMYRDADEDKNLQRLLGVSGFDEACQMGCIVGFDNRFAQETLAAVVVEVLRHQGMKIYYAGETTTGVLSAAVLQLGAAFSINFTPSHNPLEYSGLKFNASDAGPAAEELTRCITEKANMIIDEGRLPPQWQQGAEPRREFGAEVERIDSFRLWQKHVIDNASSHGLDYEEIIARFEKKKDMVVVIDSVHGASRLHMDQFFRGIKTSRLVFLRNEKDVTFGGVAPEPSSENMIATVAELQRRSEPLKLGAIIDPDGDRIRFTDGTVEISMNQFGAMAYHFLHEWKNKQGMVAKTVASSNLANSVAAKLNESIYEPRVGFKEFKPVIDKALVCFEESDGISIIGHTPEKDAYIGLLLALDMMLSTGRNLGEFLKEIEDTYGHFYPAADSIKVAVQGRELLDALERLRKYQKGSTLPVNGVEMRISEVIDIDGIKILFEDGSWLMVRPSGTEPKVRFYVESRNPDGTEALIQTARGLLREAGLLS